MFKLANISNTVVTFYDLVSTDIPRRVIYFPLFVTGWYCPSHLFISGEAPIETDCNSARVAMVTTPTGRRRQLFSCL